MVLHWNISKKNLLNEHIKIEKNDSVAYFNKNTKHALQEEILGAKHKASIRDVIAASVNYMKKIKISQYYHFQITRSYIFKIMHATVMIKINRSFEMGSIQKKHIMFNSFCLHYQYICKNTNEKCLLTLDKKRK